MITFSQLDATRIKSLKRKIYFVSGIVIPFSQVEATKIKSSSSQRLAARLILLSFFNSSKSPERKIYFVSGTVTTFSQVDARRIKSKRFSEFDCQTNFVSFILPYP